MPKDSLPWDQFRKRMERLGEPERAVVEERLRTNYRRERYEFFTDDEAAIMGAILDRVIPQDEGEGRIALVAFMDWAIPIPLGYGDRNEALPDEPTVFRKCLAGVDEVARSLFSGRRFIELGDGGKDQVLRTIQEDRSDGDPWRTIPGSVFFRKLMMKAVAGYCAHPRTWARIGFYGPAYPEGYIWVSQDETEERHEKKPGHLTF